MPTIPTSPSTLAALADAALRSVRLTPDDLAADGAIPEQDLGAILAGHGAPRPGVWALLGDAVLADPAAWNAARTSAADADALLRAFRAREVTSGARAERWARWLEANAGAIAAAREQVASQAPEVPGAGGRTIVVTACGFALLRAGGPDAAATWRGFVLDTPAEQLVDEVTTPPADPAAWVRDWFAGHAVVRVTGTSADALVRAQVERAA